MGDIHYRRLLFTRVRVRTCVARTRFCVCVLQS